MEIVNDRLLMTIDPAGQCGEQDLPGLEDLCHRMSLRKVRDPGKLQMLRKDGYNRRHVPVDRVFGPYGIGVTCLQLTELPDPAVSQLP